MSAHEYPLLSSVFARTPESIYAFIELKDVLNLSLCCRFTAGIGIDAETIQRYAEALERTTRIGKFNLRFGEDLTLGMLRRVMNRLNTGVEAMVSVDSQSGRIILDIGSAFRNTNAFLASDVQAVEDGQETNQEIFKHLEICSYDEYDDFNPRHPMPKDRAHRRGDSYFNSDISEVASELTGSAGGAGMDIKNLAAMALASEDQDGGSHAIKNKFMAMKKKTAGAGVTSSPLKNPAVKKPTMRAMNELQRDSDEDR